MSDPLDERFRDFATGTPAMNPASPADIRHRGDRMRRRRTALTAAGAALAVVLIATPVVLLTGDDGSDVQPAPPAPSTTLTDTPTPSTEVSDPFAAQVPTGFPLAAGYPRTNEDGTPVKVSAKPGVESIRPCDRSVWSPPRNALDVAGASYLGPEDGRARTLVLYPSDEAATAALRSIRDGVEACPTDGDDESGSIWAEVDSPWQQDSAVITSRYTTGGLPNPGLEVYQAVRVENALLIDFSYGEGGATDQTVVSSTELAVRELAGVVTAMGLFRSDPAGEQDSEQAEPADPLLDSFLPTAGDLPTHDRLGPWEQVESTGERMIGCQPDDGELGAEDGIRRSFTARLAPSDGQPAGEDVVAEVTVTVLQFGTDAAAEEAEVTVTDWIRDCRDPGGFARDDATRQGGLVETPQAGTYGTWVYPAPETCGDGCDAAWFDRMGVLADLGRMVVVSFREVGGPLEPEGLDATMAALMLYAAGRSMPG